MGICQRCHLGQMGHAQHLLVLRQLAQLLGNLLGGTTGNTGVHLVKNQSGNLVLFCQHVFHGQHNPGQLAAGGYLAQRLQRLARIGREIKRHRIGTVGLQLQLPELAAELYPGHIQLLQLLQNPGRHDFRIFPAILPQHLCRCPCLFFCLLLLLFQLLQTVIGKLNVCQLLPGFFQIVKNLLAGGAVFLAEAINHIQPGLNLLQFIRRIAQIVPHILGFLRGIPHLIHQIRHPLVEGSEAVAEPAQPPQGVLCLGQQTGSPIGFLTAIQRLYRFVHSLGQPLGILQQLAALLQGFILSRFQLRLFNFRNLILQRFHAPQLFPLVHGHPLDFPAQGGNRLVFFLVSLPQRLVGRKIIEENQVIFLVEQGGRIMLPVNVHQLDAQLPQHGHGNQGSVDPAHIFAVQKNVPLNHRLPVIGHPVFIEPIQGGNLGKDSTDRGLFLPCPYHVPICSLAQNGRDGINDNGFTGTGFTGKNIEAGSKRNIRALNNRDVFDVQKIQHGCSLQLPNQSVNFAAEGGGSIGVTHNGNHRVIACQRSQHHAAAHGIQRRGRRIGKPRQGMNHNDILGIVKAGDAFPENGIEPGRESVGNLPGSSGVVIGSETGQFLDNAQLLNIPRNGRLGTGKSCLVQLLQQLLLGFDILVGNNLHDFGLTV